MKKVFVFLLCTLFLVNSAQSELIVSEIELDAVFGDFFQFEMVGNSFPNSMGNAIGEEKYLRVENYDGNGFRMEITGTGQTEFEGETVNYNVMTLSWKSEFTLFFMDLNDDGDELEDFVNVSFSTNTDTWILDENGLDQLNLTEIKNINYDIINMNMTFYSYEDQSVVLATVITETETETVSTSGASPSQYKVGSIWTTSETTKVSGTERERFCMDGDTEDCEWDTTEIDEEETSTSTSEVLREVSVTTVAGTFETLEIQDIDDEEDDEIGNYTLSYISEIGLPVKMVIYEEGTVVMTMQLESYSVSGLENTSLDEEGALGDLPSISLILSIVSIGLITIFRRSRI